MSYIIKKKIMQPACFENLVFKSQWPIHHFHNVVGSDLLDYFRVDFSILFLPSSSVYGQQQPIIRPTQIPLSYLHQT